MTAIFEHQSDVGWFDLDANRHMKNVAYMEKAVDCRLRFFNGLGFSPDVFAKLNVAFVVVSDQTTYSRELFLGDRFRVQILCGGVNAKGTRYLVVNRILTPEGERVYEIRSMIVWGIMVLNPRVPDTSTECSDANGMNGAIARSTSATTWVSPPSASNRANGSASR